MEFSELISFQVHQSEKGKSTENLWVYKLNTVVVQMQLCQAPEAIKSIFLKFSDFIIAHF